MDSDWAMPLGKVGPSSGSRAGKRTIELSDLDATAVISIAKYMDIPSLLNALEADRALTSPISQGARRLLIKREPELANELLARVASKDEEGAGQILKLLPVFRKPDVQEKILNHKNEQGVPLLFIALKNYSFEIAKMLIEYGANLDMMDGEGRTPLVFCCERALQPSDDENEEEDIVDGSDEETNPGAGESNGGNGSEPGDDQKSKSFWDVSNLLIDRGADVTLAGTDGKTPLLTLCSNSHSWYKEAQCDIANNIVNKIKVIEKKTAISRVPVESAIDKADDYGSTPLHWACENGHLKIVALLILNGADINRENEYGNTPLQVAEREGHDCIVELLKAEEDAMED